MQTPSGAPLGDVFTFMSGLYFRGKLTYARAFARPPSSLEGVFVITPGDGLRSADETVSVSRLREFATVPIHAEDERYRRPLERDARSLAEAAGDCEIVLLGSIATTKYTTILEPAFGERLRFPPSFVGRGDMSRGGLMLRCVREGRELDYVGVHEIAHHGPRPPRLAPIAPRDPSCPTSSR